MDQKNIKSICQEYYIWYRKMRKTVSLKELLDKASMTVKKAEDIYPKLPKPKICNLFSYTNYCLRESILSDINLNTVKVSRDIHKNTDLLSKALATYLSIIPINLFPKLHDGISKYIAEKKDDNYIYEVFKMFFKKTIKPFKNLTITRNQKAQNEGYNSHIELLINNYQIPKKDYQHFLKNKDKIIPYCHKQLPKTSNLPEGFYSPFIKPCFLCKITNFPDIKFPEGVINLVAEENPVISKYRQKIVIQLGKNTNIRYISETDSLLITIEASVNNRHKTVYLIHELCHAICMIKNFKMGKDPLTQGKYQIELEAIATELTLLKKRLPEIYKAEFGSILTALYTVSFEIECYLNPNQDLPKLYANIINQHYSEAHQTKNYTYLIDENIVLHSLRSLPHAVAYVNLLKPQ